MSAKIFKTLYICYFGLREPLVQTQVLTYLREIAKTDGLKVSLLTFEQDYQSKWTAEQIADETRRLADDHIEWHCLPYHKSPSAPATIYDVLNGVRLILKLSRKEKIDFLHARTHIPMLMAMTANKFIKGRLLFDIRGLMAEEYVDANIWREDSKIFRLIKLIERRGIERASQIVVLTNRLRDYLVENNMKEAARLEVIPCCVDFSRVNRATDEKNGNGGSRFTLVYAGSVVGLYLLREMGGFFLELKKARPEAFFQVLTAAAPSKVREVFDELGIGENDYAVAKVLPAEVPVYLKKADLGISFRKATFSQIAASPTKIPEYLACGLPVVTNGGIGDTAEMILEDETGVVIGEFSGESYRRAIEEALKLLESEDLAERCRTSAEARFDLRTVGGVRYREVYRRLLAGD